MREWLSPEMPALRPRTVAFTLFLLVVVHAGSRLLFLTSSSNMASDSASYLLNVRAFLQGGRWMGTFEMGHPLYVAWCGWVAGLVGLLMPAVDIPACCKLAGILISAASVIPFYWLARWLLRTATWGLVATLVYGFIPVSWWWSGEVMSDATNTAVLVFALGTMAQWIRGKSVAYLAACMLFCGAAVAIRFASLGLVPFFATAILVAMIRSRRWTQLWTVGLVPMPIVLLVAADQLAHPDRWLGSYFLRSARHSGLDLGMVTIATRWHDHGQLLLHAFGVVGIALAAVGLLHALARHRLLAALTVGWSVLAVGVPFLIPVIGPQIRMLLPLVPMGALLIAAALTLVSRARQPILLALSVTVTVALLTWHALPDLHALHRRLNVLDAIALWHARNTEPDSLIVCNGEKRHLEFHAPDAAAVFYFHWLEDNPHFRPDVDTRRLVWEVDCAHARGRPVYCTSFHEPHEWGVLRRYYEWERVHRFAGRAIRNVRDAGFASLGERMRSEVDVEIFRLRRPADTPLPRSAPPPVASRAHNEHGHAIILLEVADALRPGRRVVPLLVGHPAAVEPTSTRFGRDEVLHRIGDALGAAATTLDGGGRAELRVPVPAAVAAQRLYAAYALIERNRLEAISVAAPLARGLAQW
ncbi:MAG: hypothetical protein JXQ29_13305 [Planctomycetes bacterium]|nr:hypothetical protein [Planctomycetota bacterium]